MTEQLALAEVVLASFKAVVLTLECGLSETSPWAIPRQLAQDHTERASAQSVRFPDFLHLNKMDI